MVFESVIGLEIHAQLLTHTKIFCGCVRAFGAAPNSSVCPVCLGLPGALPVLNKAAVDLAVKAALALGCRVQPVSVFARKNYFYPDLPKGYQISQYDRPLAVEGGLDYVERGVRHHVGILRLHLEEDAGKSLHDGFADSGTRTYVDFNRSGVPLVEIVTRPDLRTAGDAAAFFERLRAILVGIGVCDGNMEEGSLRCDANVSVRPAGVEILATSTEIKNLNSFRFLQRALQHEIDRQRGVVEGGGRVTHETRLWDQAAGCTVAMRSKEEAHDYRYFPEPDLPPLVISPERIEAIRATLPELPEERKQRLMSRYSLPESEAAQLAASAAMARYFEAAAAASGDARTAGHWITGELTRAMHASRQTIDEVRITPDSLGGLVRLAAAGTISGPSAKEVFEEMFATGQPPEPIVRARGLARIDDPVALAALVRDVVASNPKAVAEYRGGKTLAFGFFVGQVMKRTKGRADPALVNALLEQELQPRRP
ncbi:MAG: aspartyl/glutamyl-tRNA(Asn/Gln) amidotransferase subunit [Acidobacteria bacterium]|nr:aspartyl/glutamyl-tRNA(Asn/Gln) amidotransferase subunit [Acidobacteriota bacterium]